LAALLLPYLCHNGLLCWRLWGALAGLQVASVTGSHHPATPGLRQWQETANTQY